MFPPYKYMFIRKFEKNYFSCDLHSGSGPQHVAALLTLVTCAYKNGMAH